MKVTDKYIKDLFDMAQNCHPRFVRESHRTVYSLVKEIIQFKMGEFNFSDNAIINLASWDVPFLMFNFHYNLSCSDAQLILEEAYETNRFPVDYSPAVERAVKSLELEKSISYHKYINYTRHTKES